VNLQLSGLPALIVQVGFIVVFSAPVWLAAKIVGAKRPTLIRAALSLIVGAIGSAASILLGGGFALLLAPLAFLLVLGAQRIRVEIEFFRAIEIGQILLRLTHPANSWACCCTRDGWQYPSEKRVF